MSDPSTRRGLLVTLCALGLGFGAAMSCDSDSGPGLGDQAAQVAEALCQSAFSCDCDNDSTDRYASEMECVQGVRDTIVDRAVDDVGLTYDGDCAQTVAEALGVYGCSSADDAAVDPELFRASTQLRQCRLFFGGLGPGDACQRLDGGLGDDCGPSTYCDPETNTCVAFGEGELEESCESDADCEGGLRCLMSVEDMELQCLPLPGPDEPCSLSADCGPEAYCSSAGSCVALPTAGQSCAPIAGIGGLICAPGSACANNVCEAGSAEGEACGITCGAGLGCESGFCRTVDAAVCSFAFDVL